MVVCTDVETILLDTRLQGLLYNYALSAGEERAWLDRIFQFSRGSRDAIIRHVAGHRTHCHVRYYAGRVAHRGLRLRLRRRRRGICALGRHLRGLHRLFGRGRDAGACRSRSGRDDDAGLRLRIEHVGDAPHRVADADRLPRSVAAQLFGPRAARVRSPTGSGCTAGACSSLPPAASAHCWNGRSRSIRWRAQLRGMPHSHATTFDRSGWKRPAPRMTAMNTSCATSSAIAGAPVMCGAKRYTSARRRRNSSANAVASPPAMLASSVSSRTE